MTREEVNDILLKSSSKDYLIELSTGYGKTKMALDKIKQWYHKECKILIVIPKLVLKNNWREEIEKWNYQYLLPSITFSTYISLPKHVGCWDIIIFDEGHHLSDRCKDALIKYSVNHTIFLSATFKRDFKSWIKWKYKGINHITVNLQDAIDSDVLPNPKVILLPFLLNSVSPTEYIEVKAKKEFTHIKPIVISYSERWKYKRYKGAYRIQCTEKQYYNEMSSLIEWYKKKGDYSVVMKNTWLHKCNDRLKWLSNKKNSRIIALLKELHNYRVLTFCGSIEQSENLGKPCVNSKIGTSNLELFNSGKIKHITACSVLDEGVNLQSCKIGIFQMINSSSRVICQRVGRILRHKHPVLVFPFFKYTREDEIVQEIIKEYQEVYTITDYKELLELVKED